MVDCELSQRHPPEALRCPRCDSSDTKFCYFNNYNTSQPRHFCKSCKRYWTAGGSLRNVPVGGGLRKNKKCKLLNEVNDMVLSSSSPDEHFRKSSFAANPSYAFPSDGFTYEVPVPVSFAPPLFMATPSSSAHVAGDGTLPNSYAFRNPDPGSYGFFAENRMDDHAVGMAPSLVNSINVRQHALYQADCGRTLPEAIQQGHLNLGTNGPNGFAGADQAQPQRGCVLQVAQPQRGCVSQVLSEPSPASLDAIKDVHTSHSADLKGCHLDKAHVPGAELNKMSREESADASVVTTQQTVHDHVTTNAQKLRHVEDNQPRDVYLTENEDEELGNVVNVRYPYDWEQVSEVLFGGTPDFFQLSGY